MVFDSDHSCTFECRYDFSPAEANAGAVEAAVKAVGAKNIEVTVSAFDLFNYDLKVRWS
ncbi:MAG: DUF2378 family protein [Myxococcaceae bacterium]